MTLATKYQDEFSVPIAIFKSSSSESVSAVSAYAPTIHKFAPPSVASHAAAKNRKFSEFMGKREQNPDRAQGLKTARAAVAEALYSDEPITIKVLRLRSGLTQSQLAAALDTSQPHVARLESGRQDAVMSTCRKLCKALNVTFDELNSAFECQEQINESRLPK